MRLLLLAAIPLLAQNPDARAILERSAKATGDTALESIKTRKLAGRLSAPGVGIAGTFVSYYGADGERYQRSEIPGAGIQESGNNGDVEWENSTLTGPKILRVARAPLALLRTDARPDPHIGIAGRFRKLETAGQDRVNGKPCYVVRQWVTDNDTIEVCYDAATFFPARMKTFGERPVTMTFADYRPVGGVQMPFLIEASAMSEPFRMQVESIVLNEPLPPQATELPEEIEKLAQQHLRPEIREVEEDKDRPVLRRRRPPPKGKR